jgi:hypothetical protein
MHVTLEAVCNKMHSRTHTHAPTNVQRQRHTRTQECERKGDVLMHAPDWLDTENVNTQLIIN